MLLVLIDWRVVAFLKLLLLEWIDLLFTTLTFLVSIFPRVATLPTLSTRAAEVTSACRLDRELDLFLSC